MKIEISKEEQIMDILKEEACDNCIIEKYGECEAIKRVAHKIANIFKPVYKDTRSKREREMDAQFERIGVKPRIYHFTTEIMPTFKGITIATVNIHTKEGARRIIQEAIRESTRNYFYQPATRLLKYLGETCGEAGIAICNYNDQYDRNYGRNKAKGRLLQYLLRRREVLKNI